MFVHHNRGCDLSFAAFPLLCQSILMKHHRNLAAFSLSLSLPATHPSLTAKNLNNFYYVARYEFLMSPMPHSPPFALCRCCAGRVASYPSVSQVTVPQFIRFSASLWAAFLFFCAFFTGDNDNNNIRLGLGVSAASFRYVRRVLRDGGEGGGGKERVWRQANGLCHIVVAVLVGQGESGRVL